MNDQSPPSQSSSAVEDGGLAELGSNTNSASSTLSTTAVNTPQGPMAFVVYSEPRNFSRGAQDDGAKQRNITLQVNCPDTSGSPTTASSSVLIARPPVVLVHGMWSNAAVRNNFNPLGMPDPSIGDPRFLIRRANYDSVLTNPSVRARERNRSPAEPAIRIEAEFLKAEAFKARRLDKASSQATGSRARKLCLGGSRTPFAIHPSIALQTFERSAFGDAFPWTYKTPSLHIFALCLRFSVEEKGQTFLTALTKAGRHDKWVLWSHTERRASLEHRRWSQTVTIEWLPRRIKLLTENG